MPKKLTQSKIPASMKQARPDKELDYPTSSKATSRVKMAHLNDDIYPKPMKKGRK